jgi:hypothetical protein
MRIPTVIVCLAITAGAFGFVHKPKMPKPNVPESTQGMLQQQQSMQGTRGPVGDQKAKTRDFVPLPASDSNAADIVAASAVLADASKNATPETPQSGSPTKGPIGAVAIGVGAFLVFWVAGKRSQG